MKSTILKYKELALLFALLPLSVQNVSAFYDSDPVEQEQEPYGYPAKVNIFNYSEKTATPNAADDGFDPLPPDTPDIPVTDGVVWIGLLALGLELRRRRRRIGKESQKN